MKGKTLGKAYTDDIYKGYLIPEQVEGGILTGASQKESYNWVYVVENVTKQKDECCWLFIDDQRDVHQRWNAKG